MPITISIRRPGGDTQSKQLSTNAELRLLPGETLVLPPGFAGQFAINQPAAGDLTLRTPSPGSIVVVVKGFVAGIESGAAALELGGERADTLPELLDAIATAAGGEADSGSLAPSSGGSAAIAAFEPAPLGGAFGASGGPAVAVTEPNLNILAIGGDVASLDASSVETRFASLVGPAGGAANPEAGGAAPSGPVGQAVVAAQPVTGLEDSTIALSIQASVAGQADSLQVVISGLPAGASLNAGTALGGGMWAVDAGQLAGLAVTPAPNDDSAISLTVTAIATLGGQQSTDTTSLQVTVIPVIDRLFTPGDDVIDLSALPDVTQPNPQGGPWAEDGNRTDAGNGNDTVALASAGPNALPPGTVFFAGAGNDRVTGGSANDTIQGGAGNDTIHGGAGSDTAIFQGSIGSYLFAPDQERHLVFSDQVAGRDGADTITAIERVSFAGETYTLITNANAAPATLGETIADQSVSVTLISPGPQDTLTGTADRDLILGVNGSAVFIGGAGADVMRMIGNGIGSGTFVIEAGSDHAAGEVIDGRANGASFSHVLFDSQVAGDTLVVQGSVTNVSQFQMYHLVGTLGGVVGLAETTVDLNIDGSALTYGASFQGNLGANALTGTGFDDFFTGGAGTDLLFGGGGDDQFIFASATELAADAAVVGGAGTDTIRFSGAGSTPVALVDADLAHVSGVEKIDLIAPGTHTLTLGQNADAAFAGNVVVSGNGNSTTLIVDGSALTGKLVVDRFHGPDSTIIGGSANDTLSSGFGSDTIDGGAGTDTVVLNGNFADYSFAVNGGAFQVVDPVPIRDGTDTLSNVELLRFADQTVSIILGNGQANILIGTTGKDVIAGLGGADTIVGGAGDDVIVTEQIDRVVFSGTIDQYRIAQSGTSVLVADQVAGRDGTDTLNGFAFDVFTADTPLQFAGADFRLVRLAPYASTVDIGDGNAVVLGSDGSQVISSGTGIHYIDGGAGNDTLSGNVDADYLFGGAGHDSMRGGGGNDTIYFGQNEYDFARFTGTIDQYRLSVSGSSLIIEDMVAGRDDTDTVIGAVGNEISTGSLVFGLPAFQTLQLGQGVSDYASTASTYLIVFGNAGNNTVALTGTGLHYVDGGGGDDVLSGGTANDLLIGGDGNDTLNGGGGDDVILGGAGPGQDTASFTGLRAEYGFANNGGATFRVIDSVAGRDGGDTLSEIEALRFADQTVTVIAAANNGLLAGGDGAELIVALGGVNTLDGGGGSDILLGDAGDNFLIGGAGADTMNGGQGTDYYIIEQGSHHAAGEVIQGASDALLFMSTLSGDTLTLQPGVGGVSTFLVGDLSALLIPGGGGITGLNVNAASLGYGATFYGNFGSNLITGSQFADRIFLSAGDDAALALGGNDTIDGNAGIDTVILQGGLAQYSFSGGADDSVVVTDLVAGRDGVDTLLGVERLNFNGVGYDLVSGTGVGEALTGGSGRAVILGFDGDDTLTGGTGADYLLGGAGNDTLNGGGGGGADTLAGGGDNDTLTLGAGDTAAFTGPIGEYSFALNGVQVIVTDQAMGRDGTDLVNGVATGSLSFTAQFAGTNFTLLSFGAGVSSIDLPDAANYLVIGNALNNDVRVTGTGTHYLAGGGGNDTLLGGSGTDYLHGGLGADTLNGGAGSDTILYRAIGEAGDTILNFDGDPAGGQDTIDLDGLLDALGIATGDRDDRVSVTSGGANTWLLSVDADGDQGNGFEVGLASIASADPITVGQDIQLGQL